LDTIDEVKKGNNSINLPRITAGQKILKSGNNFLLKIPVSNCLACGLEHEGEKKDDQSVIVEFLHEKLSKMKANFS